MPGLPAISAAVFTDGIRPPIPGGKSIGPISRFSTGQCQWFRRGKSARITWHWQATSNMAYSGAVTCCPAKRPSVYGCGDFSDLVTITSTRNLQVDFGSLKPSGLCLLTG